MARRVEVDIVGNADDFNRATKGATQHAQGLTGGLKGTAVAGLAVGVASAGVTAAIDLATSAIAGSIEAAREDTASQDLLALAYKNTGQAQELSVAQIEKVISANQAKGVSDSAQRAGIASFLDLTKSSTDAMALNNAAVELAAAKGIDYAAAQKIILSAANGRTAALAKAGVAVEKDASATSIAASITDKFGGSLDRVAKTQQGKNAIANEKMGEAMEKVGRIINDVATTVIPVLVDILVFITDKVIPPLVKAFEKIAPVVVAVFSAVVTAVRVAVNAVVDVINTIIRGINAIQVHIHVGPVNYDFDGLNLGYLPRLHAGGIVPGAPGSDVLTVLQAGERVTPASGAGSGGNTYNVNVTAIDPQSAARAVVDAINEYERRYGKRFVRVGT